MAILGHARGINTAMGPYDIWHQQTAFELPEPSPVEIKSTRDSDSADDIGARQIIIYGLPRWGAAEQSEVLEMDGTTPIETANDYVFCNRLECLAFGDSRCNTGTITATMHGQQVCAVPPKMGHSLDCVRAIPSGQELRITALRSHAGRSNQRHSADIALMVQHEADNPMSGWSVLHVGGLGEQQFATQLSIEGPAVVKATALFSTAPELWCSIDAFLAPSEQP